MTPATRAELKPNRIEALSDGIFAIAMTILVLSFETIFRQPMEMDEKYIINTLAGLWPDFIHYVQSFVILGVFWYQHHRQFHYIKRVNAELVFFNIIGLMFIALIPFSTVLVSDYGNTRPAALVFELNLLIAGLVFFMHWLYASHKHRLLDDDLGNEIIRFYAKRNLVIPAVSLCGIVLSLFSPRIGTILYFSVPFILFLWRRKIT
ncbi:TMEM175 family protein [Candidatus Omnitrophota bacterium]